MVHADFGHLLFNMITLYFFGRVMESFFTSLNSERTARKVYRTRDDARADAFD